MGNKLGRRTQMVDEKFTKPQGLYQIKDVDHKKLKKLILESKLAPCYPGNEESGLDLEECPICFLYYPSLNRSRCCMKGICTECFLQMKTPNSARPTQCPFCKTSNYAVEYRGVKTKEEKGVEQIEEQRVIEAKIRMRQQEIRDEAERTLKRKQLKSSSQNEEAFECDGGSVPVSSSISPGEAEEIVSLHNSYSASIITNPTNTSFDRDDIFDMDLEEIMVAEAMWLSIQESERRRSQHCENDSANAQCVIVSSGDQSVDGCISPATTSLAGSSSPSCSGGLARAIAQAIAERRQSSGESSSRQHRYLPSSSILPGNMRFYNTVEQEAEYRHPADSSADVSSDNRMVEAAGGEWNRSQHSEGPEAGVSYASYNVAEVAGVVPSANENEGALPSVAETFVPQSFEEQMMLAISVSLADVQAVSNMPGVTWH